MGSPKTTSNTNQTTTPTPTAEETEMNRLQLEQYKAYQPAQTKMMNEAFGLGSKLLNSFQGSGADSEQWKSLIGGITDEQTNSMVAEQDRYLRPMLEKQGIYDSGTAATGRMRAGVDVRNQNAQFNVGTLQNALNLALSGQAQIQQPAMGQSSALMTQLAGLRANQGTGWGQQKNPLTGINIAGSAWGATCWVAAEIFGGDYTEKESWENTKTINARYYIINLAPRWFNRFYNKHGEAIAKFIHNKPILKAVLRPLFECFALMGKQQMEGALI